MTDQCPSRVRRLLRFIHHWVAERPHHKKLHLSATLCLGLGGLIGLALILLPRADLSLSATTNYHRSQLPGLLGIDLLAIPVCLLGIAAYRAWWALRIDVEAWKQHRRRGRSPRA
jgi:hypothetical protein